MSQIGHAYRSPDVSVLLGVFENIRLRYVLVGSVAALAHGVEGIEPKDLDIVPECGRENLVRLAAVLDDIEASPEPLGGHWEIQPDGEYVWVEDEITPELQKKFECWRPDPDYPNTYDFLFRSRLGNFDVVPEMAGNYQYLVQCAVPLTVGSHGIQVAHIDDLLVSLTKPRRKKDGARVRQLRSIQNRMRTSSGS